VKLDSLHVVPETSLQVAVQIDEATVFRVLKTIRLDVLPETADYLGSGFLLNAENRGQLLAEHKLLGGVLQHEIQSYQEGGRSRVC